MESRFRTKKDSWPVGSCRSWRAAYVFDLDPLVGLGLPSYSLSSAMVLTAILTAISDRSGVFAGVRCRRDSLTSKDFRILAHGSGRGAGNWGSRARGFKPVRHGIR